MIKIKPCSERLRENCIGCNKEDGFGDICHAYQAYQQGRADAVKECKTLTINTGFLLENDDYCWQHCSAIDMCGDCKRLSNGDIDFFDDTFDDIAEQIKEQKNES